MVRETNLVVKLPQLHCDFLREEAAARNIPHSQLFSSYFSPVASNPTTELPRLVQRRIEADVEDIKGGVCIGINLRSGLYEKFLEISDRSSYPRATLAKIIIDDHRLNLGQPQETTEYTSDHFDKVRPPYTPIALGNIECVREKDLIISIPPPKATSNR
jgi:hypothetical protein